MNDILSSTPSSVKPLRNDSELVSRLKMGDGNAFSELVDLFQEKIFKLAYGITLDPEESRDIVQDVFLKAFQNIESFRGEASLSTWLHRITVNICLNWKRRWKRRFRSRHQSIETEEGKESPELITDAENPEHHVGGKQFMELFEEKFRELPEVARTVFVLKELDGLSYEEIAQTLGIKKGTVSSRLFYARKRLQDALRPFT